MAKKEKETQEQAAAPAVEVDPRAGLIREKMAAGLTREQAELVVANQEAHDETLKPKKSKGTEAE